MVPTISCGEGLPDNCPLDEVVPVWEYDETSRSVKAWVPSTRKELKT